MERAILGIDGNAAYALLGEDLQVGESEWVTIESDAEMGSNRWRIAARHAATIAYSKLLARLPERRFGYTFGEGHPNYRPPDETDAAD